MTQTPPLQAVLEFWVRNHIQNPRTATVEEIASFEAAYAVTLPASVRDYFSKANGTKRGHLGMDDPELLSFWHLDQVRPLHTAAPELASARHPDLFVFADYSIWALGFAVSLDANPDNMAPVYVVGGPGGPVLLAASFTEFLRGVAEDAQFPLKAPESRTAGQTRP